MLDVSHVHPQLYEKVMRNSEKQVLEEKDPWNCGSLGLQR